MYTKEITVLSVEDLRHLTQVEMFGIIAFEARRYPSLRDCLFSLINKRVVSCDKITRSVMVSNDDYDVSFIPQHEHGMDVLFIAKSYLKFLDHNNDITDHFRSTWDIDAILDNLEHFDDIKNE